MDLLNSETEQLLLVLWIRCTMEFGSSFQDAIRVNTSFAVQTMPHHGWEEKEEGLEQEDEGDPLVVKHSVFRFILLRNVLAEGQIVRVVHPTETLGVLGVAPSKFLGDPASDGVSHILLAGDDCGKDHQHDAGVPIAESISKIIIQFGLGFGCS